MGRINRLRPSDLVEYLTSEPPPLVVEASIFEPNDDVLTAHGPLQPGETYTAYLHDGDLDFYFIQAENLAPIEINLTGPADVDYDLALFDSDFFLVESSESETSQEYIGYVPSSLGTYYIVVVAYAGYSLEEPYILLPVFNGEAASPVIPQLQLATVQGRLVDSSTGLGMEGAEMLLLIPGVTGEEFIESDLDPARVQGSSFTAAEGVFVLLDVPRGQTYTGFVITTTHYFWENDYLTLAPTGPDLVDVGDIQLIAE